MTNFSLLPSPLPRVDREHLRTLISQGYLYVNQHPQAQLYISNYTAKTQYNRFWNEYTLQCRGLIFDQTGKIVARPFPKFFNLGSEVKMEDLPAEPFEVYEKLDGSLGVLYWAEGQPQIATRGSFESEQAAYATRMLYEQYASALSQLNPAYTYLFEIIYPGNRIVVDYHDREELILLAIIDTPTGRELPLEDVGFPVVRRYDGITDLHDLEQHTRGNDEGLVIRFRSGLRLKVKFAEYVRLHRIITGLSELTVWEYLSEGKSLDALLEQVPDEVYDWVKQVSTNLLERYQEVEALCQEVYQEFPTRKETALYFQQQAHPSVLFAMLNGKDYAPIIWKMLRPQGSNTYF